MSNLHARHATDEQLLRYADGELPGHEAHRVRSHLEACWQCRAELDELQKTVSECVHYRKAVLQTCLPPPPVPWADLSQRFAEADAAPGRPSLLDRLLEALQAPARYPRRWLPVAATLLLIWGVVYQFRYAPSVRAAGLLRKAAVAAEARPSAPRRIRIRTRMQSLTRVIGFQTAKSAAPSTPETATLASLKEMFHAAHYGWEDPLSAKFYLAWRDQLSDKRDEVTTVNDRRSSNQTCYQIRTTTNSGELMEATLRLRTQDLAPLEETLQFRNREWVEMTELSEVASPAPEAVAEASAPIPGAQPFVSRPVQRPGNAAQPATLREELEVFAALHRLGADLGDPVEVTREGGQVLVSGVGVTPERQQAIHAALDSLPRVIVRFSEPAQATFRPETQAPADNQAGSEPPRLQARLEEQLGGRASFQRLADEVLDMSEGMMARAYALRRLAERFPPAAESQMSVEDLELLRQLRQEHATALAQNSSQIQRRMNPLLVSLGAPATAVPASVASSRSWQAATKELFRTARQVETLLAAALGGAAIEIPDEELPSQLLASLAELQADLEAYQRFTKGRGEAVR